MIAFLFPGQGSQYPGMGQQLVDNFPEARRVFDEASDALGFDMAELCFRGSEDDLRMTANTQPAILTTSIAALRVLEQETGLSPAYAAGHSLGEFSALVAVGALGFADAVRTVRQRGTFMQEAVPVGVGAMAAIMGVEREILEIICQQASADEIVSPANFNSPGQIVIAGHAVAVERAITLAKEQGAKRAMLLPVSAPFHSALMQPAAKRLAEVLIALEIGQFRCPVVGNVEALIYTVPERVKPLLVQQVCAPVRWDESVLEMDRLGVKRYVEIGPGKVLCGLVKRIVRGSETAQVDSVDTLAQLVDC
ncbi:ACP S-malonyltransferase [Geopsychrobacter electrodiphilus]|uniref:ACP S-malonyltransferase n=1 Tax=Geopsychrobacter electrodiphilus TaxID=225196 RepID=UPI00036806C6|nr:ACP S-malonyltransferase [Geopsychrobacter electrodiphilus]